MSKVKSQDIAFLDAARVQTMRADFNRLRKAIRIERDPEAIEDAFDMCERWLSQLTPITDRQLLSPGGTTDETGGGR